MTDLITKEVNVLDPEAEIILDTIDLPPGTEKDLVKDTPLIETIIDQELPLDLLLSSSEMFITSNQKNLPKLLHQLILQKNGPNF